MTAASWEQWLHRLTAGALCLLAGCSGGGDSGYDDVSVRTVPDGAACDVTRGHTALGAVTSTPGSLRVDHSDKDLIVTCRKPGWQTTTGMVRAVYRGIGLGQLLNGGAAAVVEDAARSDGFRYDPAGASVTLLPK